MFELKSVLKLCCSEFFFEHPFRCTLNVDEMPTGVLLTKWKLEKRYKLICIKPHKTRSWILQDDQMESLEVFCVTLRNLFIHLEPRVNVTRRK